MAELAVGFVQAHHRAGAGRETAVGIEGDALFGEKFQGLAHPAGDGRRCIDAAWSHRHATQANFEILAQFTEHAQVARRFTILRSLVHGGVCHDSGPQQIFTGHPKQGRRMKPEDPDVFTIVNYLRSDPSRVLPAGVNKADHEAFFIGNARKVYGI